MRLRAGQVVVDWRDGPPKEANKRRPAAVVVEDAGLFDPSFPDVLLVPRTDVPAFVIPALSVAIDPTPENGCSVPCRARAHGVTATSKHRVRPTDSTIASARLERIRQLIGVALGLC